MEGQEFVQWAVGQGVAVVVLAFVLVRVDQRLAELQKSIDRLLAFWIAHPRDAE